MHVTVNRYNRIKYDNNGVFSDFTEELTEWGAQSAVVQLVLDEDFLYIGAPHSFASRFFKVDTVNDQVASLSAEYFSNNEDSFQPLKNFQDETRIGAIPFARDGYMTWDIPEDWISTQVDGFPELPTGQTNAKSHPRSLFWIRIKSSASLNALTSLRWLGMIWTSQEHLLARWAAVLNSKYLPDGQTDWYPLIEISTRDVYEDLELQNIIDYELQAKDIDELANMTGLKTLVNILLPMRSNEDLSRMREDWNELYIKAVRKRLKSNDRNQDEKLSEDEKKTTVSQTRIIRA